MSELQSSVIRAPRAQLAPPLLAVALPQGRAVPASLAALDRATDGAVARAIASGDFKGKRDELMLFYPASGKAERLLLVGLGKAADVTRASVRRAAAVAAKRGRALGVRQFAFAVLPEARVGVPATALGQVVVEWAAQGAWAFTELKAAPEEPTGELEAVAIVCDPAEVQAVAAGQRLGDAIAAGHQLARYLQMQPGNVCTPSYLAARARALADQYGFALPVLDPSPMARAGMGALLALAPRPAPDPPSTPPPSRPPRTPPPP